MLTVEARRSHLFAVSWRHCLVDRTFEMVLTKLTMAIIIAVMSKCSLCNNVHSNHLEDQHSLNPTENTGNGASFPGHNWLKVSASPPTLVTVSVGTRTELECEAIGSPRPTIQWYHGRESLQKESEGNQVNDMFVSDNSGIGKMKSRLILDCVLPHVEGSYTCMAFAGSQTALAPSTMVLVEGASNMTNLTTLLKGCECSASVYITSWSPVYMEVIGHDVLLPCRAEGCPTPDIYWLDNESQPITKSDRRFKVLASGDLYISKLRWSDMGGYTCIATNSEARDAVTTFVYPVLNEDN